MFLSSFWALAAAACFSMVAVCVKWSSGVLSACELVCYRSLFSVIFLFTLAHIRGYSLRTPHLTGHLVRSSLGTLSMALWFYAITLIPLSTSITLTYTTPLFMSVNFLLLALWRHQRAPWMLFVAIVLGFAGVITTLQPRFDAGQLYPALLCLLVALIDLGSYWQIRILGNQHEPSWRIVFYFSAFGVIFGAIGAFLSGGFHALTLQSALLVLEMGLFATAGQLCATRAYAKGNMLLASCLGFSAIAFSALLGWGFFDEAMHMHTALGMTLITMAGILATCATRHKDA